MLSLCPLITWQECLCPKFTPQQPGLLLFFSTCDGASALSLLLFTRMHPVTAFAPLDLGLLRAVFALWPLSRGPHVPPGRWQGRGIRGPVQAWVPAGWSSQPSALFMHEGLISAGHRAVNPSWDSQH